MTLKLTVQDTINICLQYISYKFKYFSKGLKL